MVLLVVMAALFYIVFLNRGSMLLGQRYEFKTVACAFYGSDNSRYVIDEGKKAIGIIGEGNILTKRLKGGTYNRFYYAQAIADGIRDGKKTIYISDMAYRDTEDGTVEAVREIRELTEAENLKILASATESSEVQNKDEASAASKNAADSTETTDAQNNTSPKTWLAGMTAILVMSGETTKDMLEKSETRPDLVYGRLGDMVSGLINN